MRKSHAITNHIMGLAEWVTFISNFKFQMKENYNIYGMEMENRDKKSEG